MVRLLVVNLESKCAITGKQLRGKLTLVDLAGSERISKSGVENERKRYVPDELVAHVRCGRVPRP